MVIRLTPQPFTNSAPMPCARREEARLREDSLLLENSGCFSIVLEKIPATLAIEVSSSLKIPTIGIGAGGGVDGQVLVIHDMLGINKEFKPRFLRRYLSLYDEIKGAVQQFSDDVKRKDFPNENEQY
jgi:3-methyl-2-oxobutanoate hydroxymethyltransferase